MARSAGSGRVNDVHTAAERKVVGRPNTTKRPTYLLRSMVALLYAYRTHGHVSFPKEAIFDLVAEHIKENNEPNTGRRAATYVRISLDTLERKAYIEVDDDEELNCETIQLRPLCVKIMHDIERQMNGRFQGASSTTIHRAYCDHFRKRLGKLVKATYTELVNENAYLRRENTAHQAICPLRSASEASDAKSLDHNATDFTTMDNDPIVEPTASKEPVAGPSFPVTPFPCSPVRRPTSSINPQAAYPSPESLPRPRWPRPTSSSPPPSPTTGSHASSPAIMLGDDDDMDVDDNAGSVALTKRLRDSIEENERLREQNTEHAVAIQIAREDIIALQSLINELEKSHGSKIDAFEESLQSALEKVHLAEQAMQDAQLESLDQARVIQDLQICIIQVEAELSIIMSERDRTREMVEDLREELETSILLGIESVENLKAETAREVARVTAAAESKIAAHRSRVMQAKTLIMQGVTELISEDD